MRRWSVLLVLILVAAACGAEHPGAIESGPTTILSPTAAAVPEPVPAPDRFEPGSQQASRRPEPVSEPILKPVPAPVSEPSKPTRTGLPAPPPLRPAPVEPGPTISDDLIDAAVGDLATRLGVAEVTIDVLDSRPVTWRDGSIGCPEPGLAYTQAEVPGSLIVLGVGDSSYRYHAAEGSPFFYCENPRAPLEGAA